MTCTHKDTSKSTKGSWSKEASSFLSTEPSRTVPRVPEVLLHMPLLGSCPQNIEVTGAEFNEFYLSLSEVTHHLLGGVKKIPDIAFLAHMGDYNVMN